MCKSGTIIAMRVAAILVAILSVLNTSNGFAQGGAWSSKASMPAVRSGLASSVLDGKIYVIAGHDKDFTSLGTTEEYDPNTDTWTRKNDLPSARFGHCAVAANGKIYVMGGVDDDFLKTMEEYDPDLDIWIALPDMPTARAGLECTAVDGKIYTMGGFHHRHPGTRYYVHCR